ncbi:hypothetical protein HY633_04625 [Candidatus Uhrbacteria bacterium]|nr:hypothetical protein [Candidatus Uhrbacteria bacterium]
MLSWNHGSVLIAYSAQCPGRRRRGVFRRHRKKIRLPRRFWVFLLIAFLAAGTRAGDALMLLRARDVVVPIAAVPLLYALFHLVYASLAYPFGAFSFQPSAL